MHPAGIILIAGLLFAAGLLWRSRWEKRQLKTEHYELKSGRLPEEMRIVFLSDLHSAAFGKKNKELIREINKLKPEAVLIGGDMITCGRHTAVPPRTDVCTGLMEVLCSHYPVYYAEGNHESRMRERFPEVYEMFTDHLRQLGVVYLRDERAVINTRDLVEEDEDDIKLCAVSLEQRFFDAKKPGFGRKEPMPEEHLENKLGKADRRFFNILMMHSPLYLKEAAAWGADLVLCGHFHGGTIRLPFLGGLMTPQLQFFVKECSGLFSDGHTRMIVNRGLGTHSVKIRLNDLPEISCIDLIPDIGND